MPRNRKAVTARKKRESHKKRVEDFNTYNEYGYRDPTAYQAIKNIMREEQRTSCTQTMTECEAAIFMPKKESTTVEAKTILTIREAARAYDIPEFALRNWCKRGQVQHLKAGNRVYLTPANMENFIKTGGTAQK